MRISNVRCAVLCQVSSRISLKDAFRGASTTNTNQSQHASLCHIKQRVARADIKFVPKMTANVANAVWNVVHSFSSVAVAPPRIIEPRDPDKEVIQMLFQVL